MITQDSISRVIDASVIEDVISDYVSLKRRGVNLLGNCPFHEEKTPSFTVSPAKGIYKCFGCGKAGNSVSFLMEHEQLGFADTIRQLGRKFNVEIEETKNTAEEQEKISKKENWQVVLDYATSYYSKALFESETGRQIGLSYFIERGLTEETIKKWKLGYSKEAWSAFHQEAINAGYNEAYLADVGLIKKNDKEKWYDVFRNRVIFPIQNAQGKVVAFAGRVLQKEVKAAKYLNSPETELYKKSYILYGLHQAKTSIRKEDKCYLSEGYLDVISLAQAGIENVVAASGTSFTEGQAKLIKRFTENVTVLFDGDAAGMKAAFRSIDLLLGFGFNVRVVAMPEGEDPDSLCQSMGGRAFKDFLDENEQDFIIYKSKLLMQESENDPIQKAKFVKEVLESVAKIKNAVKRAFYIKECAQLMDVDESVIQQELHYAIGKSSQEKSYDKKLVPKKEEQSQDKLPLEGIQEQEKALVKMILLYGEKQMSEDKKILDFIVGQLEEDEIIFTHEIARQVFNDVKETYLEEEEILKEDYFLKSTDQLQVSFIAELLTSAYQLSKGWEQNEVNVRAEEYNYTLEALDLIRIYKLKHAKRLLKEAQSALQSAEGEVQIELLMEIEAIKKIQVDLGKKLGTVYS